MSSTGEKLPQRCRKLPSCKLRLPGRKLPGSGSKIPHFAGFQNFTPWATIKQTSHSRSLGKNSIATGKNSGRFKSTLKNYLVIGRKLPGNLFPRPFKSYYRRELPACKNRRECRSFQRSRRGRPLPKIPIATLNTYVL